MTKTISDLTEDLVAEIFSRVPITSLGAVRSTCKGWNSLSRQRIFGEVAKVKKQILGFIMKDFKICSVRINLQEINNNGDDFIDLSIKNVSVLDQLHVVEVYHCDGLLLCRLAGSLLVWNPYMGQKKWIQHIFEAYDSFVLGYDNNHKHKILQILEFYEFRKYDFGFKIYEFSSNSWRVLEATPKWRIPSHTGGINLKGNAYFYVQEKIIMEGGMTKTKEFLVCFDFTSERFGPLLSLPFHSSSSDDALVTLSCVKNKKLAVLYQNSKTPTKLEIWVTNKIDYDEVLWTKWMDLDMNLLSDFPRYFFHGSFFVDEESKVVVAFGKPQNLICFDQAAYIIGQDGYFKSLDFGGAPRQVKRDLVGYFPSLVQIE